LQGAVDLSGVDPIKDTLVAANGSTAGNALDGKLDVLQAVLAAAQTTLPELAAAIAASGTTAAPVQAILQPAAADCASLRSGSYVTIKPTETDIEWAAKAIRIDAPALTVSYLDGTTPKSVQMTADGGCAYTIADDGETTTKMLVARSGLAVGRDTVTTGVDAGQTYAHVTIPLQSIPLSELAGTWNKVEYFRDPIYGQTAFSPFYGSLVFDASGTITAWTECDASGACGPAAEAVGGTLRVNPDGGYEGGGSADEPPSRAFAFKTADGHLSMFLVYSTGRGMVAMTKQESQPLPAVGTVSSIWDFSIGSNGLASTLVEQSTTITAVDAAAGTLTRLRTGDSRVDTFRNDDPQTGMRSRAANSCTIGGSATTCAGIVSLTLPGTGVWMYVSSAPQNFFGISIAKP
jgi:hypothetical protein